MKQFCIKYVALSFVHTYILFCPKKNYKSSCLIFILDDRQELTKNGRKRSTCLISVYVSIGFNKPEDYNDDVKFESSLSSLAALLITLC